MKVLIAPTAFKGTLSPLEVAEAIAQGIKNAGVQADGQPVDPILLPLADGGDGSIAAVHRAAGGTLQNIQVLGAMGQPVTTHWLRLGNEALIELAGTCGIAALDDRNLDALNAHTYGLGQAIARCYEAGMEKITIAVGGSASTDGGMGALKALGAVFFDENGNEMDALGGGSLLRISGCDFTELRKLSSCKLQVLTDVTNPLLGPTGASHIFAPQKGANPAQVELLDKALAHFAQAVESQTGTSLKDIPGAGAAGGTAFGLAAALGARLVPGFDWIATITGLETTLSQADLVITAEGSFDHQSFHGKVTGKLADLCKARHKALWLVAAKADNISRLQDPQKIVPVQASSGTFCTAEDISQAVQKSFQFHNFATGDS